MVNLDIGSVGNRCRLALFVDGFWFGRHSVGTPHPHGVHKIVVERELAKFATGSGPERASRL